MKVTFLGTGTSQGVPVIGCTCPVCRSVDFRNKRLRTSVHIQINGSSFVIDTGPDFRQQMLREKINQLDAVLVTHSHKDHVAGMDDVRAFNFMHNKDMEVYGLPSTLEHLRAEFHYAFAEKTYPGAPRFNLISVDHTPFKVRGINIVPLPVKHLKMPVLGYRMANFSYITDANYIGVETMEELTGTKVLVINALQKEKHISHFNLSEAIDVAQQIGAEQTFFTHISHKMGLHEKVEAELPDGINLAYDGLTINLDCA